MTTKQAAVVIGCNPSQVRYLIRSGTIKAKKKLITGGGYSYTITQREAERFRDTEQTGGWPRGQNRV